MLYPLLYAPNFSLAVLLAFLGALLSANAEARLCPLQTLEILKVPITQGPSGFQPPGLNH